MIDPRTFWIDTETDLDCESCSWTNTDVTVWDDIRDGTWSYEFECASCGHLNKANGNSLDRGATQVLFMIAVCGLVLLVIGAIGALGGHWPQGWLMLLGFALIAAPFTIALFMGAKELRKDNQS